MSEEPGRGLGGIPMRCWRDTKARDHRVAVQGRPHVPHQASCPVSLHPSRHRETNLPPNR
eukprot:5308322-Pyramimonas_sp.AAC.1